MTQQTSTRRGLLAASAGGFGVALAGCLDTGLLDAGEDASGELGDPAAQVTVDVMSIPRAEIDPTIVHIEPGGTVEWVGQGAQNTLASYHPDTYRHRRMPEGAEPFQSELLREGDRFTVAFEREGVYDYVDTTTYCAPHEALGAVGRVVVGRPDLTAEPALQHDPNDLPSRAETVMRECNDRCREQLGA